MSKISIGNINQIIKNTKEDTVKWDVVCKGKTYTIEFKKHLSIEDESRFVERVVGFSFNNVNNEFLPQYNELGKYVAILQFITNVEIPTINESEIDIDKCKEFIEAIKLKSTLDNWYKCPDVETAELEDYITNLCVLADEKVEYIKNQNINVSKLDGLFDELTNFVKELEEKTKDVDLKQTLKQASEVFTKVNSMNKNGYVKAIVDNAKKESKNKTKKAEKVKEVIETKDNITKIEDVKTK